MSSPPKGAYFNMLAHFWLSEMLHDQEKDLDAAKTLESAVALMDHNIKSNQIDQNGGRDIDAVRARMHFFFGSAYGEQGDRAQQLEHLDKAVAADSTDADALIALYRLPNPTPERKAKTSKQIREAAEIFRQQIKANADDASPNNQLAWLVSNTEGDYQEALRSSQRSLELKPNTSAYLDTLGRCYYAVGDLENAVINQRQAVKLEPHSFQLQRQLKFFEEQLAKRNKAAESK